MVPDQSFDAMRTLLHRWPLVDIRGDSIDPPACTVSLAHDGRDLVVSFEMLSEPPLVLTPKGTQAPAYQEECVELFLTGPSENAHYLEVVAGVSGALYTARVFNPDGSRSTWRVEPHVPVSGLSVAITGHPAEGPRESWHRWRCTMRIPWTSMPFGNSPPRPGETRRGNCYRIARGKRTRFEALSATFRTDPPDFHIPERFALFRFAG